MLFIDGKWRLGEGEPFTSTNPANDQTVWRGAAASAADVGEAFAAAKSALSAWSVKSVEERSHVLRAFAEVVRLKRDELAAAISAEVGKPRWDAASEVDATIGKIDVTIDAHLRRRAVETIDLKGRLGRTWYRPLGVVAVYGPFNFPAHIANGQIVPALLAGNSVLFKPSELTPHVAELMTKYWGDAGLPPGVLNLLQGAAPTGRLIAEHPDLRGLFFTGSLPTGLKLRETLVHRPEVLLALELGGNNPLVVMEPDQSLASLDQVIQSAFITSGQRCTCVRRLILVGECERFLAALREQTAQIVVNSADANPEPFMGPLIHAAAVNRILSEQRRLVEGGAVAVLPSKRLAEGAAFLSPGLIDVTSCKSRSDEEMFGPLLQVIRVDDFDAAIAEANDTRFGLVAGLLGGDREDFERFRREVSAGLVNWNVPTTGASGRLPFGGIGWSGNYRPAGYFATDFCSVPVAGLAPSDDLPRSDA
ncbi:succinylglutamate-semialdehyde dehydrogenase [Blastopirellula sp. JC732]|uniref:Succinylglutamate-semialdehyde dehydrogenase n=1 Tax=Blastopirellula sediminis TaxID=2894196 RepID=A0A9X1MJQ8_9BACT|nr:succinylglutamate-semialdehyde dehydrogenase [Blastopirellula sediminis]MCC9609164.1 succinylglutamate-semialdehyde dehydrogenase [Blastopirellula sediminis]MCC9628059.1 succinylglutamate-semialdehyde dehydrogenase [Blastopirellula sediminis]